VIALLQFRPDPAQLAEQFQQEAEQALRLLAERPGFVRGTVGRATDDAGSWLLLTEWESVGAYRRGLGGYQVKLIATPLLSQALDQPSAFEQLLSIGADGQETVRASDRAEDADWTSR
jgi:heme oxygenase (mycobilin-producing)